MQGCKQKQSFGSVSNFLLSIILGIMLLGTIISSKDTYASEFKLSEGTLRQYRESSKSVAGTVADSTIEGMFQNDLDSSGGEELRKNLSSYKGANVADAGLDIERAKDKGARQRSLGKNSNKIECTEDHCELGSIYSSTAVNNRDIAMEEVGFKKDEEGNIIDNKGYLDKAKKITKEASGKFDFIKGEYRGCEATVTENVAIIKESCDQYYDVIHNSCPIKQVVEIDPRYVYQCNKKREVKEKVCTETVSMACEEVIEGNVGTINIEEVGGHLTPSGRLHYDQRALTWEYTYPNLSFTSENGSGVRERYCRDQCGVKNSDCCKKTIATGRFRLSNVSEVGAFRLKEAGFDNHGMIKLNERVVYNTWGGDKLEIAKECYPSRETYVDAGSGRGGACNLHNGTNLNNKMDIELKQHLKEGWNELEVTWIYAVRGQYKIKIEARQRRCKKFNEKTEVKCEYVD